MLAELNKLAQIESTILLTGETGTGKSRLARVIHQVSRRRERRFVTVHLASISEDLLESELFGHVRGAFTGAIADKKGYCELVGNGYLFLDEIGEISVAAQKKLLFLLEEKKYLPVGSCCERKFAGQIIAATNRNLEKMVEQGEFREDLYYRLLLYSYRLPPLRENPRQLEQMIWQFWVENKERFGRLELQMEDQCLNVLRSYHWPGNIRELKNCMEYLVNCSDKVTRMENLPHWLQYGLEDKRKKGPRAVNLSQFPLDYHQALENFEKLFLHEALTKFNGKISLTARELHISKSTLIAKVRKYGINIWDIKMQERRCLNVAV